MTIQDYLADAIGKKTSDVHISVGKPVIFRIKGALTPADDEIVNIDKAREYTRSIMNDEQAATLDELGEVDFAYSIRGLGRFRVNIFMQRHSPSAAIRIILSNPPNCEDLNLPKAIIDFTELRSGLVLVVGPTGSGKSTTLASLINRINKTRAENIITLEDPIEYLHKSDKSIVSQREIGNDTKSYANALRAVLRQDPDVILIGEMRDLDTISIAITAAETGHLVFSTLHTMGAAKTIDRITDAFPSYQQNQVRLQLSTALKGVVSQQLLPRRDAEGRVAAFEIMVANPAIGNLIRENKSNQITNVLQTNRNSGMVTMDASLAQLVQDGIVDPNIARQYSLGSNYGY